MICYPSISMLLLKVNTILPSEYIVAFWTVVCQITSSKVSYTRSDFSIVAVTAISNFCCDLRCSITLFNSAILDEAALYFESKSLYRAWYASWLWAEDAFSSICFLVNSVSTRASLHRLASSVSMTVKSQRALLMWTYPCSWTYHRYFGTVQTSAYPIITEFLTILTLFDRWLNKFLNLVVYVASNDDFSAVINLYIYPFIICLIIVVFLIHFLKDVIV